MDVISSAYCDRKYCTFTVTYTVTLILLLTWMQGLLPHAVFMFVMVLRINSRYVPKQIQPLGLRNGNVACFVWRRDWIFRRVRIVARKRLLASSCPSVCLSCLHVSARLPLDGFPWNLILQTHENLSRDFKFGKNRTKISGTLLEDRSTFYCF